MVRNDEVRLRNDVSEQFNDVEVILELLSEYSEKLKLVMFYYRSVDKHSIRTLLAGTFGAFIGVSLGIFGGEYLFGDTTDRTISSSIQIILLGVFAGLFSTVLIYLLRKSIADRRNNFRLDVMEARSILVKIVQRAVQFGDLTKNDIRTQFVLDIRIAEAEAAIATANSLIGEVDRSRFPFDTGASVR